MKIASIDKHPIMRAGLSVFLKTHFEKITVIEAECLCSYLATNVYHAPDIIIVGLAEESAGIDMGILKRMMQENPETSFVVYDGRPQVDLAVACFKAGVKGYLLKSNNLNELVQCMESVIEGHHYICYEFESIAKKECVELLAQSRLNTWCMGANRSGI